MKWEDIKVGQRIRFLQYRPIDGTSAKTIVGFSGKILYADSNSVQISGIGRINRLHEWTIELIDDVETERDRLIRSIKERAETLPQGPL